MKSKLLFVLLLISCTPKSLDLPERLLGTVEIKKLFNFSWGQLLNKPENTKFALLEFKTFDSNSLKLKGECLFIQTAFKKTKGKLFIAKKVKPTCKAQLFKKQDEFIEFINLKISLKNNILNFYFDGKSKEILLPNLKKNVSQHMEIYTHQINNNVKVLPPINQNKIQNFSLVRSFKDFEASPFNIPNRKCHSVDAKCRSKKEYTCDSCPFGYIEVVGSLCSTKGDKYCAPKDCGGVGEIACYRGSVHPAGYGKLACQNESQEGLCQFGLKTICQNGVLFCR